MRSSDAVDAGVNGCARAPEAGHDRGLAAPAGEDGARGCGGDASRANAEDGGKRQENVVWAGSGCDPLAVRYAAQYWIVYSMAHTER
jgi:hypothetical protein